MFISMLRCASRLRPGLTTMSGSVRANQSCQIGQGCFLPKTSTSISAVMSVGPVRRMSSVAERPPTEPESKDPETKDPGGKNLNPDGFQSSTGKHRLTDTILSSYEKRKLVWTGFYKSMDEVPDRVSESKLTRAGDLWRIYTNIGSAVFLLTVMLITIKLGQRHRRQQLQKSDEASRAAILGQDIGAKGTK